MAAPDEDDDNRAIWGPDAPPESPAPQGAAGRILSGGGPLGRGTRLAVLVLIAGIMIAGASLVATRSGSHHTATTLPGRVTIPLRPDTPQSSIDPTLSTLVLKQSDVDRDFIVDVIPLGATTAGATLDLCNRTYPSEKLRTARLQVALATEQGATPIGTEAVFYDTADSGAQAMAELKSAAAACPRGPVTNPADGSTITTHINPPPDGSWPAVAGIDRQSYDVTLTGSSGRTLHLIAVYLRRGRALLGVYFQAPDGPQPAVAGQTTIPGIVDLFAKRLAALSARAANGIA